MQVRQPFGHRNDNEDDDDNDTDKKGKSFLKFPPQRPRNIAKEHMTVKSICK